MKKKLLTLLITLTMVFSMAVPAFAATADKTKGLMLASIGDSIGSGCINADFIMGGSDRADDSEFLTFMKFTDGKKVYDCDAVKLSFVSKLYNKMEASKYSKNLAFPGLRSKDLCRFLGLKPLKKGDYDDKWKIDLQWACEMDYLGNEYNVQQYNTALKHADVITVELGENDLTGCLINHIDRLKEIIEQVADIIPLDSLNQITLNDLANDVEAIDEVIASGNNECKLKELINKLEKDLETMKRIGDGFADLIELLAEMTVDMTIQSKFYGNEFLNYIDKTSKDGSIVVVCSMIDPFKDITGALEATKILDVIIGPFVKSMNKYYKNLCGKYGFEFVDVSSVSLNPGDPYFIHPNEEGQQFICDSIYKAVNKKLTDCRKAKLGVETTIANAKEATYLEDGYTGDEVCTDCGEVLMSGSVIPKLVPNATKIKKLKATCKRIKVNWAKADDVDGYQIQCSTASKFNKNKKTVTVSKATATKAEVKKIKSGKKYYVRVRTFKKVQNAAGETVKVYSKWSPVKTTKTK